MQIGLGGGGGGGGGRLSTHTGLTTSIGGHFGFGGSQQGSRFPTRLRHPEQLLKAIPQTLAICSRQTASIDGIFIWYQDKQARKQKHFLKRHLKQF